MIEQLKNIREKLSNMSEVIVIIVIIVLVLILQFWSIKSVYQKDKFLIEKELYDNVRWQVEDWNHKGFMLCGGGVRAYYFQEGGRELVLMLGDSLYVFKVDTKNVMDDVYLRIACDLNVLKPITLQVLDSMVGLNLNSRLSELLIVFQRVDSTGKVLEVFPDRGRLPERMNRGGSIQLGFLSGESINIYYLFPRGYYKQYIELVVWIFIVGAVLAGFAIMFVLAYHRQKKRRKCQIKWIGDDLHSLKTPVEQLGGIMQWFELKCSEPAYGKIKAERAYACLNEILQNMDECILACSILHKTKLKLTDVNLKTLLLDLIDQQREAHQGEKVPKIELDYRLPNYVVYSSAECLTLIVRNLLDNAVKYSKDEIRVWVRVYQADNKMVIEVEDRGIGISDKDQKVIFNEYYRVEGTGKKGCGRGLPYVIEIVEKMRGKIEVKSELGKGSCFKILIPIWEKKDEK